MDLKKFKELPEHGSCFVCGTGNPKSIGMKWFVDKDKKVFGNITLTKEQQGPPKHAHGGASAALLDEAMGAAAWVSGYKVMSVNLNINFLKPVPLGVPIRIEGYLKNKDGKKIFAEGQIILPDSVIAVEGRAILVEPEGFFGDIDEEYNKFISSI